MKVYRQEDRRVFKDHRGVIDELLPSGIHIGSAAYITGNVGAVRGNHYHKKDEHYCLVIGGVIEYSYMEKGSDDIQSVILRSGDMVYSPAGEVHKFVFHTEGIFLALAIRSREQKNYESDTVRKPF